MQPKKAYKSKLKTHRMKKRSIGSKAQKKTNKITKWMMNEFFIKCDAGTYKNTLLINLVILFVFCCAFEPTDLFFFNR